MSSPFIKRQSCINANSGKSCGNALIIAAVSNYLVDGCPRSVYRSQVLSGGTCPRCNYLRLNLFGGSYLEAFVMGGSYGLIVQQQLFLVEIFFGVTVQGGNCLSGNYPGNNNRRWESWDNSYLGSNNPGRLSCHLLKYEKIYAVYRRRLLVIFQGIFQYSIFIEHLWTTASGLFWLYMKLLNILFAQTFYSFGHFSRLGCSEMHLFL